jgi:hypothetical protein
MLVAARGQWDLTLPEVGSVGRRLAFLFAVWMIKITVVVGRIGRDLPGHVPMASVG